MQRGRGIPEVPLQLAGCDDPAPLEEGDDAGREAEAGPRRDQVGVG